MSFNNLLNKPYYRGIIYLLKEFQDQKDENGKTKTIGLRQIHFRYALMNEPNIYEDTKKKIKDFFDKRTAVLPNQKKITALAFLQQFGYIKKGSVKSPQKLTNYLEYLVQMGIVKKQYNRPWTRYMLSEKYFEETDRKDMKSYIEGWHYPEIISERNFYESVDNPNGFRPKNITHTDMPGYYDIPTTRWFLCGFSTELLQNLSLDEKKVLNRCLTNIEKNLWEIMELKCSKTKTSREKQIKKVLRKNKKAPFPHKDRLGFYYNAKKLIATTEYPKKIIL